MEGWNYDHHTICAFLDCEDEIKELHKFQIVCLEIVGDRLDEHGELRVFDPDAGLYSKGLVLASSPARSHAFRRVGIYTVTEPLPEDRSILSQWVQEWFASGPLSEVTIE
jgi:hypothetical protein